MIRKITIALAIWLLAAAQASAAPPQVAGEYVEEGEGNLRFFLTQTGNKLKGRIYNSKSEKSWDVSGTVDEDGQLSMTHLVPLAEFRGDIRVLAEALERFGDRSRRFLVGRVTLIYEPRTRSLSGEKTDIVYSNRQLREEVTPITLKWLQPLQDPVINLIGDPVPVATEKAARQRVRLIFEPPASARIARARVWFQDPEAGGAYRIKPFAVAIVVDRSITVQVEYPLANVVSKKLGDAQGLLKGQLLSPVLEQRLPLPADQIYVSASLPVANTWVRPRQKIRLFLGLMLADYRGRNAGQALAELRELGFRTAPLAPREVENRREGVVVAQTPAPGIVAYRSMVSLTAAVAPPLRTVIDLLGDPVPVALEKAAQHQVRLIFDPPASARIATARVWFQSPEAGGVYVNDSITVQVEYPLANVVEMPLGKAREILAAQRLTPVLEQDLPLAERQIHVWASRPPASSLVRPGQKISLVLGVRLADYRGRNGGEAEDELRRLGFAPTLVERRQTPNHAEREVLYQVPKPAIVAYGTRVRLTVAAGDPLPPIAPVDWWPYILGGGILLAVGLLAWFKPWATGSGGTPTSPDRPAEQPESPPGVTFRPRTDAGRQSVTSGPQAKDGKGFSIRIHGDSGTQRVLFPHDPASEEEI